jgi:hypothetical protein
LTYLPREDKSNAQICSFQDCFLFFIIKKKADDLSSAFLQFDYYLPRPEINSESVLSSSSVPLKIPAGILPPLPSFAIFAISSGFKPVPTSGGAPAPPEKF